MFHSQKKVETGRSSPPRSLQVQDREHQQRHCGSNEQPVRLHRFIQEYNTHKKQPKIKGNLSFNSSTLSRAFTGECRRPPAAHDESLVVHDPPQAHHPALIRQGLRAVSLRPLIFIKRPAFHRMTLTIFVLGTDASPRILAERRTGLSKSTVSYKSSQNTKGEPGKSVTSRVEHEMVCTHTHTHNDSIGKMARPPFVPFSKLPGIFPKPSEPILNYRPSSGAENHY